MLSTEIIIPKVKDSLLNKIYKIKGSYPLEFIVEFDNKNKQISRYILLFNRKTKDHGKVIDLNQEPDQALAKIRTPKFNNQINNTSQLKHFRLDIRMHLKTKICNQISRILIRNKNIDN